MPASPTTRPPRRRADGERRLAAIVSVDMAGFSALSERDETAAAAGVKQLRRVLERRASAHGGRVFSSAGDGFMLEFPSPVAAVECALALAKRRTRAQVRIGVHLGDVMVTETGDLLGHGVNVAARLRESAEPGGVVISAIVRDMARAAVTDKFAARGKMKLAKMSETIETFALAGAGAVAAPASTVTPTLAVLAFDCLSGAGAPDFFSDGVSEEIIYAVARIDGLKVIGSTSSFHFRGGAKKDAARALGATHVLDGSARRSGDKVRILAQLSLAQSGVILWSHRFDRPLNDAFAVQQEIAGEVARALALALSGAPSTPLATKEFDAFLHAREHMRDGAPARMAEAAVLLEWLVEAAPHFARGWSALAVTQLEQLRIAKTNRARLTAAARQSAQAAIARDPNNGEAYSVLAALELEFGRWRQREALLQRALEAEPNNPYLLFRHGQFLISVGRVKDGYAAQARAQALDPLDPMLLAFHAHNVWATGAREEGRRMLEDGARLWPDNLYVWYMRTNLTMLDGEIERGAQLRDEGYRLHPSMRGTALDVAGRRIQEVMATPTLEAFVALAAEFTEAAAKDPAGALDYGTMLAAIGQTQPALAILESALDNVEAWRGDVNDALRINVGYETALLFVQATAMLRTDPNFVRLCARLGLVAYWRDLAIAPDCAPEVAPMYDFAAEMARYP